MDKNKENVPKIRFPGFTGPWEQRKLGDYVEDYIEKTVVQNQYPVLTSSQQRGIILQEDYFANRQVTTDNNIGYYVLPKGYFTFRSRSDNDVFVFNRNDLIDKGIISYFYPVFSINNADSNFFLYRINNGVKQKISMAAEGTGQKVLSLKKFKNIKAMFPNKDEQEQVGAFLNQLDNLITLHQRKLEHLQDKKKGLLQKMFPKEGEKFPELRFPGFTDPWEQRKLGEMTTSFSGGTPSVGNKAFYNGNIPFIRSGEINNDTTELFISEDGLKNSSAKLVEEGDILYALYGATSGEVSISRISGAINQAILALKPLNNYNSFFIMQWLRNEKEKIISTYLQGGQGNLSGNIVKELMVPIPKNKQEQEQIGIFFSNIDNLITLHQRKLEHLQQQKKGLLQQMFI